MEDLINLKEYAKQYNISWYICKQWLEKGLRHIGTRPYMTKVRWINEFLESNSEAVEQKKTKYKVSKPKNITTVKKIDINDYI